MRRFATSLALRPSHSSLGSDMWCKIKDHLLLLFKMDSMHFFKEAGKLSLHLDEEINWGVKSVTAILCKVVTPNSAASRAGLIIRVNKRDASLLSSILKLCPSLLSPLSSCWLYLTVPPSHRQKWQSASPVLLEYHPSPTDGPDHSRSRYETWEKIRHDFPFYLELIFQLPERRALSKLPSCEKICMQRL